MKHNSNLAVKPTQLFQPANSSDNLPKVRQANKLFDYTRDPLTSEAARVMASKKMPVRVLVYQNFHDFDMDNPFREYVINYNNMSQRRGLLEQQQNALAARQILIYYDLNLENEGASVQSRDNIQQHLKDLADSDVERGDNTVVDMSFVEIAK